MRAGRALTASQFSPMGRATNPTRYSPMHRTRLTATGRAGRWPEGLVILEGRLCLSLLIQVSPNFVVILIVNVNRRYIHSGSKGLDSPETTSITRSGFVGNINHTVTIPRIRKVKV